MINSWMYQTVFTNRYGRYSVTDSLILFADMAILIFLANSITDNLREIFRPFCIALGFLSLSLLLQYALKYRIQNAEADRRLIRDYIGMLTVRSVMILLGAVLPDIAGVAVMLAGVVIGWISPAFFVRNMRPTPVNFPHLVERMTLLVIISFGETIIGTAVYFTAETISVWSLLVFVTVAAMFSYYVIAFDKLINHESDTNTGVRLIYSHYPILIGLSFVTVSFHYLSETEISLAFTTIAMYMGLTLFYTGILLNSANREQNDDTARPAIANTIENFDSYDTIIIGHPIWWGTIPRIIYTFMDTYDLSGKNVYMFCTSGSSGISTAVSDVKKYAPNANLAGGMRGTSSTTEDEIKAWLEGNGYNK